MSIKRTHPTPDPKLGEQETQSTPQLASASGEKKKKKKLKHRADASSNSTNKPEKHAQSDQVDVQAGQAPSAPSSLLGQVIKLPVVDSELDSIFKSTSFLPLQGEPSRKVLPSSKTTPSSGKTQTVDDLPPHAPTKIAEASNAEATLAPKRSAKKPQPNIPKRRDTRDSSSSLEAKYERQRAIKQAKLFAQALLEQKQSAADSNKTRVGPKDKTANTGNSKASSASSAASDKDTDDDDDVGEEDIQDDESSSLSDEADAMDAEDLLETSDSDQLDAKLVHETLTGSVLKSPKRVKQKARSVIPNETKEQLDARTVFIGNVNIACVGNKVNTRALLRHILNPLKESEPLAPPSRIDSYRFRGVPLAVPIAASDKRDENHSSKRSKAWQESHQAGQKADFDDLNGGRAGRRGAKPVLSGDSEVPVKPIKFLTPDQKRKIGCLTGNVHPQAKSCIAYVVISPPLDIPDCPSALSAAELAKVISAKTNGTSFMDHVLRSDVAIQKPSAKDSTTGAPLVEPEEQRRTVFIGGLDFSVQEDSIRKAVEARLVAEKDGPADGGTPWVERVRLVRDKATGLAKGFAYVLLRTQDAVEEMLALPEGSLKISKRKVRVQKYVSGGPPSAQKRLDQPTMASSAKARPGQRPGASGAKSAPKRPRLDLTQDIEPVYKGPDLSKKLEGLSKAERKAIKSNNANRVERRLLKRQAKLKMKILQEKVDRKIHEVKTKPLKRSFGGTGKFGGQQGFDGKKDQKMKKNNKGGRSEKFGSGKSKKSFNKNKKITSS